MSTLLCGIGLLSACVSDTLGSTNTQPIQTKAEKEPSYDPIQRAQAIAEIRQKAAQTNSGVLTNAYVSADGPNEPLTPEASAAKIEEMRLIGQLAHKEAPVDGDAELNAKKREMQALQKKALNHYDNAIDTIEN